MSLSSYQQEFTGPQKDLDLALGSIMTSRVFYAEREASTGRTVLVGHWGQVWRDGENYAKCLRYRESGLTVTTLAKGDVGATVAKALESAYGFTHDEAVDVAVRIEQSTVWRTKFPHLADSVPWKLQAYFASQHSLSIEVIELNRHAAFETCECGFYGHYRQLKDSETYAGILSVVEHYGETLVGTRGVRSSKARIIAAVDEANPSLRESYPSVKFYASADEMFKNHPLTEPPMYTD